jgi:hypothetical protein
MPQLLFQVNQQRRARRKPLRRHNVLNALCSLLRVRLQLLISRPARATWATSSSREVSSPTTRPSRKQTKKVATKMKRAKIAQQPKREGQVLASKTLPATRLSRVPPISSATREALLARREIRASRVPERPTKAPVLTISRSSRSSRSS